MKKLPLASVEKVIRDIARREGEALKVWRGSMQQRGRYGVIDPNKNCIIVEHADLEDLAERYEDCERNTPWQRVVLRAAKEGGVAE